jgi:uncharacterized membrane protein YqjE
MAYMMSCHSGTVLAIEHSPETNPDESRRETTVAYHPQPTTGPDNGIAALLHRLRNDAFELLRVELALARAELIVAANQIVRGAMLGLVGAVLMLAGALALLAAGTLVLNFWLPLWMAAAAMGIVLLIAGMLTFHAARNKLDAQSLALTHTRHSVQQDLGLLKRKAHEQADPQRAHSHDLAARGAHGAAASPR